MDFPTLHPWLLDQSAAVSLQRQLAPQVDTRRPLRRWDLVAGADASYTRFSDLLYVAIVVWKASENRVVERLTAVCQARFPYRTGLLSFREAPAVLDTIARLQCRPDVLMLDGQGIAHPRRLGLASHVGLWLGMPTIGVAKSRLVGTHEELEAAAGSVEPLRHRGQVIGDVVRTKVRCKPLFISPGHFINRASAVRVTMACLRGYRLPEPTRLAHTEVNRFRCEHAGQVRVRTTGRV